MKANDTTMDLDEYNRFTKTWYEEQGKVELWVKADDLGAEYKATLEHQAEISFPLAKQEGIREAVKVYDPYIEALEDENSSLVGLASVHGWCSSRVELGEECRRRIKAMKQAFLKSKGLEVKK